MVNAKAVLFQGKRSDTHFTGDEGFQGRSGRAWETSPPLGFDPRFIQYVVSRYIEYAIPTAKFKGNDF
jgi:hypothetical protein